MPDAPGGCFREQARSHKSWKHQDRAPRQRSTAITATATQNLREALETKEKDTILKAVDELEALTSPYAERVMNISIKQAMAGKKI